MPDEKQCHKCGNPFSPRIPLVADDGGEEEWCPVCLLHGCCHAFRQAGWTALQAQTAFAQALRRSYPEPGSVVIMGSRYSVEDLRNA